MKTLIPFILSVPVSRNWVALLILVNLLGSLWGFNWYYWQLHETPVILWPVVPDSPGSTLLFSLFLIGLWFGRRWPWLEGIVYTAMVKYGLWTVIIFLHYWTATGDITWESIYLSSSHLGMAVEALLFLHYYRPGWLYGVIGTAWLFFNDWMDYGPFQTHPTLPGPQFIGWVADVAVALTIVSFLLFLLVSRGVRNRTLLQSRATMQPGWK